MRRTSLIHACIWLMAAPRLALGDACRLELPLSGELDSALREETWACRERAGNPCDMYRILFSERPLIDVNEERWVVVRRCSEAGVPERSLGYSTSYNALPTAEAVRLPGSGRLVLECFKATEFLGYSLLGTTVLDTPRSELLPARQLDADFIELRPHRQVDITPTAAGKSGSVKTTALVVGSRHALSLAPLESWDREWLTQPVDGRIGREVLWYSIDPANGGKVARRATVTSFSGLSGHARADPSAIAALDKLPVLKELAAALKDSALDSVDYVMLLKDSWDVSVDGIEELRRQLLRLRPGVSFDVVLAKTVTTAYGYLESLTSELAGGRYFESKGRRLEVPDQDLGGRIHGRLRMAARHRAKALGLRLESVPIRSERLIVRSDAGFELGNLVTPADLKEMLAVLRFLLCLSGEETKGRSGDSGEAWREILLAVSAAGLPYEPELPLRELFKRWFAGLQLPVESPLASATLPEVVGTTRTDSGRALLKGIISRLERLPPADDDCRVFVPSELFVAQPDS